MSRKDDRPRSGARERTQAHLRKLAATAAAAVAIHGCKTATATDPGYGVVDPMPTPSRCQGTAALFHASAQYKTVSLSRLVEIVIGIPPADVTVGDITTTDGGLVDLKRDGNNITVLANPTATGQVTVLMDVTCKAGPAKVGIGVAPDSTTPAKLNAQAYDQP